MVSRGLEPIADDVGDGNSLFAGAFMRVPNDNLDVIGGTKLFAAIPASGHTLGEINEGVFRRPEFGT